jgi:hypothetical protein
MSLKLQKSSLKLGQRAAPSNYKYSYDPVKDGVSQTMLGMWLNCREKSRLATRHGWTPTFNRDGILFGQLSHETIKKYRRGLRKNANKAPVDFGARNLVSWLEYAEEAVKKELVGVSTQTQDTIELFSAILLNMLPRYFKKWFDKDSKLEFLKVEERFSVPIQVRGRQLDGDKIFVPMVGCYDFVAMEGGKLVLGETKNFSRISDYLIDVLPLDLQLGYYLTALNADPEINQEPEKVIYDILRRPSEKIKKGESIVDFAKRIAGNIAAKPDHYFIRYNIELDPTDIKFYRQRVRYLIQEYYTWFVNADANKRDLMFNSGHCENKYGTCEMLSICTNQDFSRHYKRKHASPELASKPVANTLF